MGDRRKLTSWKEIAEYLDCTVRTAQRWERESLLPVYRVTGEPGRRVFAYTDALDEWLHRSAPAKRSSAEAPPVAGVDIPRFENGSITNGSEPATTQDPTGVSESETALSEASVDASESETALTEASAGASESKSAVSEESAGAGDGQRDVPEESAGAGDGEWAVLEGSDDPSVGQPVEPAGRADPANAKSHRRFSRTLAAILLVLGTLGLGSAALVYFAGDPSSPPSSLNQVRAQGHTLIGLDAAGHELWRHAFSEPVNTVPGSFRFYYVRGMKSSIRIADLTGDGRPEVLFITGESYPGTTKPWVLNCLDDGGRLLWRYDPGEAIRYPRRTSDKNWRICFDPVDLDSDGRRELVVLSHNHRMFVAKVTVLDGAGRIRGEYVNGGRVEDVNYADLDGDGIRELIAGGFHNGTTRPALFALDLRNMGGASPQQDTPDYQCLDRPAGRELYYLLFPRDPVMERLMPLGGVGAIEILPDGIIARTETGDNRLSGTLDFFLRFDLSLDRVETSSAYEFLYRRLFEQGELKQAFSPEMVRDLDPVLYWDGSRFTATHTRNLSR